MRFFKFGFRLIRRFFSDMPSMSVLDEGIVDVLDGRLVRVRLKLALNGSWLRRSGMAT